MTTSFSSLPIIDLHDLHLDGTTSPETTRQLSEALYDVFATTGFAYLINAPLTFSHHDIFTLSRNFFSLSSDAKMSVAKKSFNSANGNTYRGYFPAQPLSASDNLKEGFEIGPSGAVALLEGGGGGARREKIDLAEANVWPSRDVFEDRDGLERLYGELQSLASRLLSLLAVALGRESGYFDGYLDRSLSTLRLLHYPPVRLEVEGLSASRESLGSMGSSGSVDSAQLGVDEAKGAKLSCTPHTDSGILTLLHQDSTGGLEVRNSLGRWVPAPYVPGSIVVNIGDLMAEVSGGRFVATMHRVRAPVGAASGEIEDSAETEFGRFSVPFFFEPGEHCVIKSIDATNEDHGILYGEHVRSKMATWVEFQDQAEGGEDV